jgi:SRSO17 transposase
MSSARHADRARPPPDHALFVRTNEDQAATACDSVAAEEWLAEFDSAFARIAGRFRRVEPRRQARAFLLGLLSDVDIRTCWQLAEQAGDGTPHRMQRLLGEAVWDADNVRDDVRGYVVDELGDAEAVLILDDTGDLKKGTATVGTQRQYTGTAGRIENSQVAVFLAYASRYGYTLIDREVYLPRSWTDDPARMSAAGVPEHVRFATKIALARRMLSRAADAGVPAAWATADEFYGGDRGLRRDLQARQTGYVLAVAKNHRVTTSTAIGPQRVDQVTAGLSRRAWNRYSAGDGAKGPRDYDWAWVAITPPDDEHAGHHWLLVRRRLSDGELAFYRCWSPRRVGLPTLIRVAGTRWRIETAFQTSKNATGLDEHQVRRWDSWYRHTTLVMLAHAILAVIAARERARHQHADTRLVPLSVNEIRRLFAKLTTNTVHTIGHWLAWSRWRRLHQARARTSHYSRRGHPDYRPAST